MKGKWVMGVVGRYDGTEGAVFTIKPGPKGRKNGARTITVRDVVAPYPQDDTAASIIEAGAVFTITDADGKDVVLKGRAATAAIALKLRRDEGWRGKFRARLDKGLAFTEEQVLTIRDVYSLNGEPPRLKRTEVINQLSKLIDDGDAMAAFLRTIGANIE
jgi:hypothetical protein